MSYEDRRRSPRLPLVLKVRTVGADTRRAFQTGDVSEHGAFVQSPVPVPVGERVVLEISFPGLLDPEILTGMVRWARSPEAIPEDDEETAPGYGVEWTEAPSEMFLRVLAAAKGTALEAPEPAKERIHHVLVADDNPHVRKILTGALMRNSAKLGDVKFEVREAEDGGATLAALNSGDPVNLLILDLYMPVTDGRAVLNYIRSKPELAALPVLVVSAGGPEARQEAFDAGADFFLSKPLRLVDILDTVRTLLHL